MKQLLHNVFNYQHNWKIQLLKNWPDILGNLSTKVHLEKINDDSLVLGVADSCWLQELYMLSPLLLRTINKKLDEPRIKSLRFKKVGIKKETKNKAIKRKKAPFIAPPLTSKEQKALANIKDPDLHREIQAFLRRCQQES